jgi:electron transport complex protein RnfE
MGLATAAVMAASSLLVAVFRNLITQEVRIPVFILIVAAMVTLSTWP